MTRKIIIVVLMLAAVGTAGLWVRGQLQQSPRTTDLLDLRPVDLRIKLVGSYLVFTKLVESFEFPTSLAGRSAFQYDTGDWRGEVSDLHVEPAKRVPSRWNVFAHHIRLTSWAKKRGWPVFHYAATTKNLRSLMIAIWPLILLFAAYPTIVFHRGPLRRWRRRKRGLCANCGYNLKGNVSGVCSECGTEVHGP